MKKKPNKNNNQSSIINNKLKMSSTPVEKVRQIRLFMQNKPNFENVEIGISSLTTSKYEKIRFGGKEKTNPIQTQYKPNTNPIQTQSKPILAQKSGVQSQFKPNQTQISEFDFRTLIFHKKNAMKTYHKVRDLNI